jgi:hypothetical protein
VRKSLPWIIPPLSGMARGMDENPALGYTPETRSKNKRQKRNATYRLSTPLARLP